MNKNKIYIGVDTASVKSGLCIFAIENGKSKIKYSGTIRTDDAMFKELGIKKQDKKQISTGQRMLFKMNYWNMVFDKLLTPYLGEEWEWFLIQEYNLHTGHSGFSKGIGMVSELSLNTGLVIGALSQYKKIKEIKLCSAREWQFAVGSGGLEREESKAWAVNYFKKITGIDDKDPKEADQSEAFILAYNYDKVRDLGLSSAQMVRRNVEKKKLQSDKERYRKQIDRLENLAKARDNKEKLELRAKIKTYQEDTNITKGKKETWDKCVAKYNLMMSENWDYKFSLTESDRKQLDEVRSLYKNVEEKMAVLTQNVVKKDG